MQITSTQPKTFTVAFRQECGTNVNCIEVSSSSLFAIGTSNRIFLVRLKNYSRVAELDGNSGGTTALCFSPEGSTLYAGGADGTCKAFRIQSQAEQNGDLQDLVGEGILVPSPDQPIHAVSCLATCATSSGLAIGCSSVVKLVDLKTGQVLDELDALPCEIKDIVWLDTKHLLTTHARGYRVWNHQAKKIELNYLADADTFSCFEASLTGILAASCADKKMVYVWRIDTWLEGAQNDVATTPIVVDEYDSLVRCLAWDRTGKFLATSDGGTATVWDFQEKAEDRPVQSIICSGHDQHSGITCLSFQPNGSLLVSGGDDSKLVFFDAANFRPGGIESAVMTISLGVSGEKITAIQWLEEQQVVVGMSSGRVLCLLLSPANMSDPATVGQLYHINGLYDMTVNDVTASVAERLQISEASSQPPTSTISTHSSSSSLNGSLPVAPANGRSEVVQEMRIITSQGNPTQPETPPQRKKEVVRGVNPKTTRQRPQDKSSFTSNVMRPYTNRTGAPASSSSGTARAPSPTRSSTSSKESSGQANTSSTWMMAPAGGTAGAWGMAPGMAPGGLQFAHMQAFNPGLHPQMMSPMPYTFITPRPSMPGVGNMAGAGSQGGYPAGAGPMSPKAVPAFYMQAPLSYPSPQWAAAAPMAWPAQQQQQLRQLYVQQFFGNQAVGSSKPPGVGGSVGTGGLIPMGVGAAMEGMSAIDTGQGPGISNSLQPVPDAAVAYPHMDNTAAAVAAAAPVAALDFAGVDHGEHMVTTLYVGNLAPAVEEMALGSTFGFFGPVTTVQVIRDKNTGQSRGFGFVSFVYPNCARVAMAHMNGKVLYGPFEGRKVKVAPSSRC